jgi:hypothetical protein
MNRTAVIVMDLREGEDVGTLTNKIELVLHKMEQEDSDSVISARFVACREVHGFSSSEDFSLWMEEPMAPNMG